MDRFSGDGMMYIPRGQCAWYRKEAYSNATAARWTALGAAALSMEFLAEWDMRFLWVGAVARRGAPRSMVGEGLRVPSIFKAPETERVGRVARPPGRRVGVGIHVMALRCAPAYLPMRPGTGECANARRRTAQPGHSSTQQYTAPLLCHPRCPASLFISIYIPQISFISQPHTPPPPLDMKVNVSQEELDALQAASLRGAVEGILGGLAISLPLSYLAHRRFPAYRALPPSLKALGIVLVVGPTYAIQTERRGLEFDEERYW